MDKAVIYSDGASRGNPGPAGIGVVIKNGEDRIVLETSIFIGLATNNVAEYQAVLTGLKLAYMLGVREVEIRSDSELVIKQLNGEYRIRNPKLVGWAGSIFEFLKKFERYCIMHVPRSENKLADELANRAIDTYNSDS